MAAQRDRFLLIAASALAVYPFLLAFRHLDDNALTSWSWLFHRTEAVLLFFLQAAGIGAAYLFSRFTFPERNPVIFLFALSFPLSALFWSEPEVIMDSSRYFTQAKHLSQYGVGFFLREWGNRIQAWTDLPLVPFLYGLAFRFLGESRLIVQVLNSLLFSLTVVLTYLTGKTLWGREVGFCAGLLLLGVPYLFTQVPLMLTDVPTLFFFILALYLFLKALERGGAILLTLAALAVTAALLSKYSTWTLLPSILAVALVVAPRSPHLRTTALRGAVVALVPALLIGSFAVWRSEFLPAQLTLLFEYQWPGLRRWEESYFSTLFFQVHPFLTLLALSSIIAAVKKRDPKYLIVVWPLVLIGLLQVKRIRYSMVAFPMLTLMASYGLQTLRDRRSARFASSCIVVFSLLVAIGAYLPFLRQLSAANLMHAGEFLRTSAHEEVEVYTLPLRGSPVNPAVAVPILDLFVPQRIHYRSEEVAAPAGEEFWDSSFRFTWDYRNPEYYTGSGDRRDGAVVVISGYPPPPLPPDLERRVRDYRLAAEFDRSDHFRYQTLVSVYLPSSPVELGGAPAETRPDEAPPPE